MVTQFTSIWVFDNENEMEEYYQELYNDPDFTFLGGFDSIQDIYDELKYQGLTEELISQLTINRYGAVLEILESPNNQYYAFIGAR